MKVEFVNDATLVGASPEFQKDMTVDDTSDQDLRKAVLAEHVEVRPTERFPEMADVTFDFLCTNCGKRHWATEIACSPVISVVGWKLACGWVSVRMPWARTPGRDSKSIYGVKGAR
jgi:hypothetical protein